MFTRSRLLAFCSHIFRTTASFAVVLLVISLFAAPGFAAKEPNTNCQPLGVQRVVSPVDDRALVSLHGNVHRLAQSQYDQGRVPDDMLLEHIILMLQRSTVQEQALQTRIDQMHNRRSPYFQKWLTPEQVGGCYGTVDSDIAAVTGWLQKHGFKVDSVPAGKTLLYFTGTAGQVRNTFHTEIHNLNVKGEQHIANMSEPQIPKALAPVVAGFRSLHNFFPKPLSHIVGPIQHNSKTGGWHAVQATANEESKTKPAGGAGSLLTFSDNNSTYYAVGPQDLYTIYGENALLTASPPVNGAGQTLAIVQDSDVNPADVTSFRSQFGLPAYPSTPNATQGGVNFMFGVTGSTTCTDPGVVQGGESEADIDVEWMGSTAPAATIDFVSCADTATTNGIDISGPYIVNSLASTVSAFSVSFGWCEAELPDTQIGFGSSSFYSTLWEQAVAEGQTPVVAAGDSGDDVCDRGNGQGPNGNSIGVNGYSVSGLASSPYNVATGGTDFSDQYQTDFTPTAYWNSNDTSPYLSALSYIPETAWNNTCANTLVADFLRYTGQGNYTPEQICNGADANIGTAFTNLDGGSGGISTVSALPTWQSVYGVGLSTNFTSTTFRNLPDVSLFASDGSLWNHVLVYCQSDQAPCDYATGSDAIAMAAGGTSFVAPMFGGIMGLINQAWSTTNVPVRQGQADYTLYALATAEYGTAASQNTSTSAPSAYTCEGSNVNAISTYSSVFPSCTFYEINRTSVEGSTTCLGGTTTGCLTNNNAQPCETSSPNCYTGTNGDTYGILSSSTSASEPAYSHSFGFNDATGLGSFNITNLVANWNSVSPQFASTTTVTSSATNPITTTTNLTATVTATGRGGLAPPMGTVNFYPGSACTGTSLGTANLAPASGCTTSCNATATLSNVSAASIGGGTTSIAACFSGDGANDGPSTGTVAVTVQAATLAVAAQSPTVTVTAGSAAAVTINLTATNGTVPGSAVSITCSGGPSDAPACTFSPDPITGTINSTATAVTVTLNTTASDGKLQRPIHRSPFLFAMILPAMLLLPVGAVVRKRKRWLLLTGITLVLLLSWTACGGGSSSTAGGGTGTGSQNYTVTITASATGAQAGTTSVTLTVNQ